MNWKPAEFEKKSFDLYWHDQSYIHCIACDYLSTDGQINRHK